MNGMRVTRRAVLRGTGAAIMPALPAPFIGSAAAAEPVRIGMVLAKQGAMSNQGEHLAQGAQFAVKQATEILGRPVELIWLDEPTPQDAVQSITRLIGESRVAAVIGGTSSANTLAMGAAAKRERVPFVGLNSSAREPTGSQCNRFMFRVPASVPVYARAMTPSLLEKGKKWYFLVASFTFGEDVLKTFGDELKAAGGTVAGVDQVPVGTTDYSAYLLKVRQTRPDVLISGAPNVGPILNQMNEMGLTGRVYVGGPAVSDTDLWSVKPPALTGLYGKTWYFDDPANSEEDRQLVQDYTAQTRTPPSDRVWAGWYGTRLVLEAVRQAGSTDAAKLVGALEGMRLSDGDTPVSFRDWDHQLLRRLVVAEARQNTADRHRILTLKPSAARSPDDLNRLFGLPEEIGCRMEPL
ncbi:ABC transporter substrate-binding protein [Roseomonas chloroacetimidivorans]|uniref:ABC transporter substrate-binding protein n=1 Tax=Roseomonas chloroacetimidivorans TaxID=1766656 RepID=UPI003C709537